jgi:hypothetical protein
MRLAQVRRPYLWARATAAFRAGDKPKSSAVRISFRFPAVGLRREAGKLTELHHDFPEDNLTKSLKNFTPKRKPLKKKIW